MIISSQKYAVSEQLVGYYVTIMQLTITNFTRSDAVKYTCAASNSMGTAEATITVNGERLPLLSTVCTITVNGE